MEEADKGRLMTTIGASGWMFLLVPAHPGCSVCVCDSDSSKHGPPRVEVVRCEWRRPSGDDRLTLAWYELRCWVAAEQWVVMYPTPSSRRGNMIPLHLLIHTHTHAHACTHTICALKRCCAMAATAASSWFSYGVFLSLTSSDLISTDLISPDCWLVMAKLGCFNTQVKQHASLFLWSDLYTHLMNSSCSML